jgi:hypothetical protein
MEHKMAMGKFPIFSLEIPKNSTKYATVSDIVSKLKEDIDNNPMVGFIGVFDHYNHTKGINGQIPNEIKDIQNIVFCFGPQVPNVDIIAVRPRSIGVTELSNSFVLNFLEAPGAMPNQVMAQWIKELQD